MESGNPYQPPDDHSVESRPAPAYVDQTVKGKFNFTDDHLVESLRRLRSQSRWRKFWWWFRFLPLSLFVPIFVILLLSLHIIFAVVMLVFSLLCLFPHGIDEFRARRQLRKSPQFNAKFEYELSDAGFRAESEFEKVDFSWSLFSLAVIFPDGVLLYRGTKVIHWIPDASLESTSDIPRIRELVAAKLPVNSAV